MSPMNAPSFRRAASRLAAITGGGLPMLLTRGAAADHSTAGLRAEGLSPLMLALVTGGLALAAALLVLVIVMLLTRKTPVSEQAGE